MKNKTNTISPLYQILFVVGAALSVLIIIYLCVALYFTRHFLPNTYFGDDPVGGKDAITVSKEHKKNTAAYAITIKDRKKNEFVISGSDIGYTYSYCGEEADIIKEQSALSWFKALRSRSDYKLKKSVTYDTDKLKKAVESQKFMSSSYYKAPENAYVKITDEGYDVIKEKQGNEPIAESVVSTVDAAVSAADPNVTLGDDCYKKPEITTESEKLTNLQSALDEYKDTSISYDFWDKKGRDKITYGDVLRLMDIDTSNATVTLNDAKIADFALNLARKYNTFGKKRKFTSASGDKITIGGGDYGWIIDKEGEAAQIKADIESKKKVSREPLFEQTAIHPGPKDFTSDMDFIEVDLTNQHVYFHKDGKIAMDSYCVSGNISKGNGTPDGVYSVKYKQSPATLVGENYSSDVKFFTVFASNVGFHDASWRGSFGGEIYKSDGSHGCVNLPLSKAKEIYSLAEKGIPVVTYYRDKIKLRSHNALISNAYSYYDGD